MEALLDDRSGWGADGCLVGVRKPGRRPQTAVLLLCSWCFVSGGSGTPAVWMAADQDLAPIWMDLRTAPSSIPGQRAARVWKPGRRPRTSMAVVEVVSLRPSVRRRCAALVRWGRRIWGRPGLCLAAVVPVASAPAATIMGRALARLSAARGTVRVEAGAAAPDRVQRSVRRCSWPGHHTCCGWRCRGRCGARLVGMPERRLREHGGGLSLPRAVRAAG
jgi:hypothetical protein